MPEFLLYGHYASGHSYKIALLLNLLNVPYDYEDVDILNERGGRTDGFVATARFNEVPVLVHRGHALSQSNAILQYLAKVFCRFGGEGDRGWWEVQEWLFWEMSRLNLGVANLRYAVRFEPSTPAPVVELYRTRAVQALDTLDTTLARHRFLVGGELSIADISCCSYLYWADEAHLDMERWPHVKNWLQAIASLPRWQPPDVLVPH
jgi:glutathione S-transferase